MLLMITVINVIAKDTKENCRLGVTTCFLLFQEFHLCSDTDFIAFQSLIYSRHCISVSVLSLMLNVLNDLIHSLIQLGFAHWEK